MKVVIKVAKVFITLLCVFPLNYGLLANSAPQHAIGKAQYHHGNKHDHRKERENSKEKQTLTFNFLLNFQLITRQFSIFSAEFKPFTLPPRVIVTTPDGRVFIKKLKNSFDIFSLGGNEAPNTQNIQIVVKKPTHGSYTLTIDIPSFTGVSEFRVGEIANVVASRDNSTVVFNNGNFGIQGSQFQLINYYTYGCAASHVPSP